jgi:cell division topological specificity factor
MLEFLKKSDFFKPFFRREGSGATAKERLRLVLLSDHLSLAPDVVDALKAELFAVLSKYVDIDPEHAEVSFEMREREVAMLASVPILAVRNDRPSAPRPGGPGTPPRVRRRKRKSAAANAGLPKPVIQTNLVPAPLGNTAQA